MPWITVTEALLKAIPASSAARLICIRAPASSPWAKHSGRYRKIRFTALSARVSVMGWALREV